MAQMEMIYAGSSITEKSGKELEIIHEVSSPFSLF